MIELPPGSPPEEPRNPYAPPEAEVGGVHPHPSRSAYLRFEVGEVLTRAWQIYKSQMGLCIGVWVVGMILVQAAQLPFQVLTGALQAAGQQGAVVALLALAGAFLFLVFQFWITVGLLRFNLNVASGRSAGFGDLFSGGPFLLPYVIAMILFAFILFGIAILSIIPVGLISALGGGNRGLVLLALVPSMAVAFTLGLAFAIRLFQFPYLVVDREVGPLDSLRISMELTRGQALKILALGLLACLINVLGLLTCIVGLIVTIPFVNLLAAVVYLALSGQEVADPLASESMPGPYAQGLEESP